VDRGKVGVDRVGFAATTLPAMGLFDLNDGQTSGTQRAGQGRQRPDRRSLMPRTFGSAEPSEIRRGLEVLQKARSLDDIARAIKELPILSHPTFHAVLQANAEAEGESSSTSQVVNSFFMIFAWNAHQEIWASVDRRDPDRASISTNSYLPPFFESLALQLGDHVPEFQEWGLDPTRDLDRERLLVELRDAVGHQVHLPTYEPTPGALWNALVVECAGCRRLRVNVRAYAIDLTVCPDLIDPLRDGRINSDTCPNCGQNRCRPSRIWIQEPPGAGDALAGLACLYRVSDEAFVYQPPAGTTRQPDLEKLHEYRCASLLARLKHTIRFSPGSEPWSMLSVRFAYSAEEVADSVNQVHQRRDDDIPLAMKTLWDETARTMRSGQLPVQRAEEHVKRLVMPASRSWPLLEYQTLDDFESSRRLALCLIRDALAEVQGQPSSVRAKLAMDSCDAYLGLGQPGLAQVALARAKGYLSNVPPDSNDVNVVEQPFPRELLDLLFRLSTIAVLDALDKTAEATGREVEVTANLVDASYVSHNRLARQVAQLVDRSARGLRLKHAADLAGAFSLLQATSTEWESLASDGQRLRRSTWPTLQRTIAGQWSGCLANLAGTLSEMKDHIKFVRIFMQITKQEQISDEDRLWFDFAVKRISDVSTIMDRVDAEMAVLEKVFPERVSEWVLWRAAWELLQRALELSESAEAWAFAGIQAGRLAGLHFEAKEYDEAAVAAQKSVEYAGRVGDRIRKTNGYSLLANIATKRGDGRMALEWLRHGVREEARRLVSMGYDAQVDFEVHSLLGRLAFEAVSAGGNAAEAVLLVENLKAVTTAFSMESRRPDQPSDESPAAGATSTVPFRRRLEQLKLAGTWNPDQFDAAQIVDVEHEITRMTRETSLHDTRFAAWVDASEVELLTIEGLQRRLNLLGQNAVLVGAFTSHSDLWTYAVSSEDCLVAHHPPIEPADAPPGDVTAQSSYLAALASAMLEPFDPYLARLTPDDSLVISLCNGLYGVPFSALPYRERLLCQQACISIVQGVGVLSASLSRPRLGFRTALCIGGPARPDREPLPGAVSEAGAIADFYRRHADGAMRVRPQQATVGALIEQAASYDVLHLACHAELGHGSGDQSRLFLAPDLRSQDSGELSERRVLAELKLRPGALVNLAGCATGIQNDTGSALMTGMVPVWMLAGASCIVGSLWRIRDDLAAKFQVQLYTHLLEGLPPALSLASTQRDCLEGDLGSEMKDPGIWSAFQIYGHAGATQA
jgi:hypothetical protein